MNSKVELSTCKICSHDQASIRSRCETCGTSDWKLGPKEAVFNGWRRMRASRSKRVAIAQGASIQAMRTPKRQTQRNADLPSEYAKALEFFGR